MDIKDDVSGINPTNDFFDFSDLVITLNSLEPKFISIKWRSCLRGAAHTAAPRQEHARSVQRGQGVWHSGRGQVRRKEADIMIGKWVQRAILLFLQFQRMQRLKSKYTDKICAIVWWIKTSFS